MSKKNKNHKHSSNKYSNTGTWRGMNASHKDAGLTVNINRLSLHMDERMTTTSDDHSFHPIDSSHFCGNDISESHRYSGGHDRDSDHCGCGFHHPRGDAFDDGRDFDGYADEFMGAPCVDMDELANIISRKLEIDISVVMDVLMAEEEYLEERGISVPLYDEDEEADDDGDSEDCEGCCGEETEAVADEGTAYGNHAGSEAGGAEAQKGGKE